MGPLHVTGATQLADCPAAYEASRIRGLRPHFPPLQRGSGVHLAAQRIREAKSLRPNCDALAVGLSALDEYQQGPEPMTAEMFTGACESVHSMTAPEAPFWFGMPPRGQVCRAEFKWYLDAEFKPCAPEDAAYAGTIDYIDWPERDHDGARLLVIDYKNAQARLRDDDIERLWQFRVYSLVALAYFPGMPDVITQRWALALQTIQEHVFSRVDPWEAATRTWMTAMRKKRDRHAADDDWPATPGDGCSQMCPLLNSCFARAHALTTGSLADNADPHVYLAGKKCAGSAAERALKELAAEEPIDLGNGNVLGFRDGTRPRIALPLFDCIRQMKDDGATDEDLAAAFGTDRITMPGVRSIAETLAIRGDIEDPRVLTEILIERVPMRTFTSFAAPVPQEDPEP